MTASQPMQQDTATAAPSLALVPTSYSLTASPSEPFQPQEPQPTQPPSPPDPDVERRQRRQVIASSIIGNVLEWYDFLVFAYQSVVISKLFFPNSDTYTRYLSVYGIFAAGFITRPMGALFFGWIGDKYSRKTALLASIYTMSIPTFLMGCLPTYATVGRLAPWLLVLTRIIQGFAVGGEFTATMVFLVEHAPPGQAGQQGSWAFFSVMVGVLCGSGVSMLFNWALTDAQLYSWGWRVPFLLSIAGAGVGAYMRRNVHEPPSYHHPHDHPDHPGHPDHADGVGLSLLQYEGRQQQGHDHQSQGMGRGQGAGLGLAHQRSLEQHLEPLGRRSSSAASGGSEADKAAGGGVYPEGQGRAGAAAAAQGRAKDFSSDAEHDRLLSSSGESGGGAAGGHAVWRSGHGHGYGYGYGYGQGHLPLPGTGGFADGGGVAGAAGSSRLGAALHSVMRRPVPRAVVGSLTVFVIDFLTAVGFYLTVIFLPTYLQEFTGLSRRQAMSVHTLNMVIYMLLTPVGGMLSDRVGRVPLLVVPGIAMAALAWPLWRLLSTQGSVLAAFEGQGMLCVIMALFNGALPATFTYLFHPKYRCTGVSVGHNVSMALCGGTAPLIATALMRQTGSSLAPSFMLMAAGVLTAVGGLMARGLFGIV